MTISKKKLDDLAYYDQIKNENELKEGIDESYDQKRGVWYDPTGTYSHCFEDGQKIDLVPAGTTSSLRMFCMGINPKTGEQLVSQKAGQKRRPGYDFTQSAPKWVSVAWSQADPETRKQIETMVIRAAKDGVDALNRYAGSTTCGAQGSKRIDCTYSAAIFTDVTGRPVSSSGEVLAEKKAHVALNQAYSDGKHSMEAYIDPQLHCHTLLPNVTRCSDGRYRKVEGSIMYQWQGVMAETFHASLARQMQEFGFDIDNEIEKVAFAVRGIPEAAVSGFSKRTGQIEQNKAAENYDAVKDTAIGEKLLQKIKTDGRRAHSTATKEEIEDQWRERGVLYGFDQAACAILIDEAVRRRESGLAFNKPKLANAKLILDKLLENESVVSDAKFRAACLGMFTANGTVTEINAIADQVMKDHAVELGRDGSTRIISTADMVRVEAELVEIAKTYRQTPLWSKADVKAAIRSNFDSMLVKTGKRMSPEQIRAAHHLLDTDDGVICLEGRAGAGKSFLINVLNELASSPAGQKAGIQIVGTSLSWAASRNLADEGGISAAAAVADFVARLDRGTLRLTKGSIVVVDEAGIVGSRDMHKILAAARLAQARVVLAGDTRQVNSVSAGGAFRVCIREKALVAKNGLGSFTLSEVRRQEDRADREAGLKLSIGQATEALADYEKMGRITIESNRDEALKTMFKAYTDDHAEHPEWSQLMIAKTNKDVQALNQMAHQARQANGVVGPDVAVTVKIGKDKPFDLNLGVGDTIQFRVKSKKVAIDALGTVADDQVYNRTRARIEKITGSGQDAALTVRLYEGDKLRNKILTISGKDFRGGVLSLDLAYCMTIDSAQGQTFDSSYLIGAGFDRARAYVACTRHRKKDGLKIFGDLETLHAAAANTYSNTEFVTRNLFTRDQAIASMAGMWATEKIKKTTLDYGRHQAMENKVAAVAAKTPTQRAAATVREHVAALVTSGKDVFTKLKQRIQEARHPTITYGNIKVPVPASADSLDIQRVLMDAEMAGHKKVRLSGNTRFRRAAFDAARLGEIDIRFIDAPSRNLIKEINNEQRKPQPASGRLRTTGGGRASEHRATATPPRRRAAGLSSLAGEASKLGANTHRQKPAGNEPVHSVSISRVDSLESHQSLKRR
jgi:hypothetical protein